MTGPDQAENSRDLDSILEELQAETKDLNEKLAASKEKAEEAKAAHEEAAKDLESALSRLRSVAR
jgi:chromosome segregation ATPase